MIREIARVFRPLPPSGCVTCAARCGDSDARSTSSVLQRPRCLLQPPTPLRAVPHPKLTRPAAERRCPLSECTSESTRFRLLCPKLVHPLEPTSTGPRKALSPTPFPLRKQSCSSRPFVLRGPKTNANGREDRGSMTESLPTPAILCSRVRWLLSGWSGWRCDGGWGRVPPCAAPERFSVEGRESGRGERRRRDGGSGEGVERGLIQVSRSRVCTMWEK